MAFTFGLYSDPALTTPLPLPLVFVQSDVSPAPAVKKIWFGSPVAGANCRVASAPGVAHITVTPVDAAGGSGSPATDVKLALSEAGLVTAIAGAALSLPAIVGGGAANAIEIHISVTDSTHAVGTNLDLSLTTNGLVQT